MEVKIFTDGASRGNPGDSAAGAIAFLGNKKLFEISKYLGKNTNNYAEYKAAILALSKLREILTPQNIEVKIFADSSLLVNQANKVWRVKHKNIKPLFEELMQLTTIFKKVEFIYIPRERNKLADSLANKALDRLDER